MIGIKQEGNEQEMTNKGNNKKKRKKPQKRKSYPFNNKKFVGGLCLCLLALITVTVTFAWTSYTEWTKNHMQSAGATTVLDIKVNEKVNGGTGVDFSSNMSWQLGDKATHTKDVKVENMRDSAAIVRLKMTEVLLSFKMDYDVKYRAEYVDDSKVKYSYGDLYQFSSLGSGAKKVDVNQLDTWQEDAYFQNTQTGITGSSPYYKGNKRNASAVPINYDGTNRQDPFKSLVDLIFNTTKVKSKDNPPAYTTTVDGNLVFVDTDFWYYDDSTGYFYYSEILTPMGGEKTITNPVLTDIKLKSYENKYKQALYGIDVQADGLRPQKSAVVAAWTGVGADTETTKFFTALKNKLD